MLSQRIEVRTRERRAGIDSFYEIIDAGSVKINKELFSEMCRTGCPNYSRNYSCPPFSPSFDSYCKDSKTLLVVMLSFDLNQLAALKCTDYFKVKIANAILKPRIEKIMSNFEKVYGGAYIGSGACRRCKPCGAKEGVPCKKPEMKRYSLESVGVDCNELAKYCFNRELLWYHDKIKPQYTSVISAISPEKRISVEDVVKEASTYFS